MAFGVLVASVTRVAPELLKVLYSRITGGRRRRRIRAWVAVRSEIRDADLPPWGDALTPDAVTRFTA